MRSWRKMANILLSLIFFLSMVLLLWTNWYYGREIYGAVKEENAGYLSSWAQYLEINLNSAYEHVYELAKELYRNTELRYGSKGMDPMTKHDIIIFMQDKMEGSTCLDCLFVLDTETQELVYQSNSRIGSSVSREIRDALLSEAEGSGTSIEDRTWVVKRFGKTLCYAKVVSIGKYRVGTICCADRFALSDMFPALEKDASLFLMVGENVLFVEGDPNRAEEIVHGRDGEISIPGMTVLSQKIDNMDVAAVLATDINRELKETEFLSVFLLISSSALLLVLLLLLRWLLRVKVVRPTNILLDANNEISNGNIQRRITEKAGSIEFDSLFESFNNMGEQITNLRIEQYDRILSERENELRLLRAQITPHFYLNAIATISNMTYQGRMEDIREFCKVLAKYMRYMLNVKDGWTTVGEELTHIENYVKIQQLRFPGSVKLIIDCPSEAAGIKIPMLMMFTVVENTFKHAMSLYECLIVKIQVARVEEEKFSGFAVTIEDNGPGFPEEVIEEMNAPVKDSMEVKEHLGLSNVRYTMALQYKMQGLLRLSNLPDGGASAQIRIPDPQENEGEL